jgi:alkanesulfonate monooxygenase SsuD/methylene tetrahydromethanopterin reductase-like flavin-dependent oxidoreductase (luciferase family)
MHLGWFMNFTPPDWDTPWTSPDVGSWANGQFYVDMALGMERAGFDFIMIEDTVMVADAYGGTMEGSLKNSVFAPKHDPVPLAVLIAASTRRLGVVATMSTSFYPPYLLARLASTVDSIAEGRFGWNIVSSAEDRAAQNFGLDALPEHDERYNVADEYFEVVNQLWDSWDADAVVMDRESHTYADYTKVRAIDFAGKYIVDHPSYIEQSLVGISSNTEIDFKRFDWDQPLPEGLTTNGERGSLEHFMRGDGRPGPKTLRQLVMERASRGLELVGTPEQVAAAMGEAIEEIGGDGFLITRPGHFLSRGYISAITDGLVPELQRLGLTRTEYTKSTLRETLREF